MFRGLSVPSYVHHQISVTVLNLLESPLHESSAQKNGVTIIHGNSVTNVVHDLHKRFITLQIATTTKELGKSWRHLINVIKDIIHQLSHSWKACPVDFRIYCSHCLFIEDQQPDTQVNPEWLYLTHELSRKEINVKASSFSGIAPVLCKRHSHSPVQVPTPLRFPCFQLTDEEITKLDEYLKTLKSCQASPTDVGHLDSLRDSSDDEGVSPLPVTAGDEDSDLSDVEREGYCDEKSPTDIIMRPVLVRKKKVKALYNNEDKVYKMSRGVRGRALIFNIKTFQHSGDTRHGSEVDYENLERLMKGLQFDVAKTQRELTDLSFQQILREIQEETSREEHNRLGMFILIIMSHGTEGDMLIDHHGKPFSLVSIRDSLSPRRFPAMAGKPKLIIVQACSGEQTDFGNLKEPSNSEICRIPNSKELHGQQLASSPTSSVSAAEGTTELPLFLKPDDDGSPSDRPIVLNVDDFLIMKSSCEVYTSIRSKTHGSWFIRVLVATFYKHSCHRDVESLFKIIQERVRKVSLSQANYTQGGNVPSAICTFTRRRKLYLFPGFPNR
ncbi:caspase-8-like [Watersipora subatra]|uniref:caspase-8-like n=1 Tax=Watersipora subatra TaxID=2589382 RepID=UPI00355BA2A7